MKKLIILLTALISFSTFAQPTKLTGELTNPSSDSVHLFTYDAKWKKVMIDSAEVKDGKFVMEFEIDSLDDFSFYDGNEYLHVYLAPGDDLHIKLNTLFFDETVQFSGKAAPLNEVMMSLNRCAENIRYRLQEIISASDLSDIEELEKQSIELHQQLGKYIDDILANYPETKTFEESMRSRVTEDNAKFQVEMYVSGRRFAIMEGKENGKPFAEMTGIDVKGKKASVSELYGKPLVIDFWATWCRPCIGQIPTMLKLEEEYEGKVTFLSVCMSSKEKKWKEMSKEFGLGHSIFIDQDEAKKISEKYMINAIPRYIFLDEEGKIVNLSMSRPTSKMKEELDAFLKG